MRALLAALMLTVASMTMAADLTEKDVKLWLSATGEMDSWLNENEDKLPEMELENEDSSVEAMFAKGLQELKNAGLYDEFNTRAKKAGFDGAEHWAEISRRISLAYVALEMENETVSISQIEAQLKQVRESALPEEQKAMMEQMMEASLGMLRSVKNVSAADKKAVGPYRDQLEQKFNEGAEE